MLSICERLTMRVPGVALRRECVILRGKRKVLPFGSSMLVAPRNDRARKFLWIATMCKALPALRHFCFRLAQGGVVAHPAVYVDWCDGLSTGALPRSGLYRGTALTQKGDGIGVFVDRDLPAGTVLISVPLPDPSCSLAKGATKLNSNPWKSPTANFTAHFSVSEIVPGEGEVQKIPFATHPLQSRSPVQLTDINEVLSATASEYYYGSATVSGAAETLLVDGTAFRAGNSANFHPFPRIIQSLLLALFDRLNPSHAYVKTLHSHYNNGTERSAARARSDPKTVLELAEYLYQGEEETEKSHSTLFSHFGNYESLGAKNAPFLSLADRSWSPHAAAGLVQIERLLSELRLSTPYFALGSLRWALSMVLSRALPVCTAACCERQPGVWVPPLIPLSATPLDSQAVVRANRRSRLVRQNAKRLRASLAPGPYELAMVPLVDFINCSTPQTTNCHYCTANASSGVGAPGFVAQKTQNALHVILVRPVRRREQITMQYATKPNDITDEQTTQDFWKIRFGYDPGKQFVKDLLSSNEEIDLQLVNILNSLL